jgi:type IV secretion system protein VirD4
MDEFANLPKIEKIENMVTVGRSRGLYFTIVIQSFSQLNAKYGDDIAAVLKGNCPVKVFIGTDDRPTCEEFSKLCGEITLETTTTSESKQKEEDNINRTINKSIVSRPLIYPDELGHLECEKTREGNIKSSTVIIKILNEYPIKVKSTYHWVTPMFNITKASQEYVPSRALDEARIAYHIADRNAKVFKPKFSLDDEI